MSIYKYICMYMNRNLIFGAIFDRWTPPHRCFGCRRLPIGILPGFQIYIQCIKYLKNLNRKIPISNNQGIHEQLYRYVLIYKFYSLKTNVAI
jgi:hypothetical protein